MFSHPTDPRAYRGPERRSGKERRQTANRREEFRFEPQKEVRRSGTDRRRQAGWDVAPLR